MDVYHMIDFMLDDSQPWVLVSSRTEYLNYYFFKFLFLHEFNKFITKMLKLCSRNKETFFSFLCGELDFQNIGGDVFVSKLLFRAIFTVRRL